MTQGLLKKLALAAPFVVCLPLCAFGADGPAAEGDDNPKVFEEFSLTAATVEGADPGDQCAGSACPASRYGEHAGQLLSHTELLPEQLLQHVLRRSVRQLVPAPSRHFRFVLGRPAQFFQLWR